MVCMSDMVCVCVCVCVFVASRDTRVGHEAAVSGGRRAPAVCMAQRSVAPLLLPPLVALMGYGERLTKCLLYIHSSKKGNVSIELTF